MSKIQIVGNISGTGTVTIESPNTNTDSTITLPSTGGTMITTTTTGLNANNITVGVLAVANGGTGANTLTSNNVILGNATSAVQFVAPGTASNVLTSDGTTWVSQAVGGGFAAGTVMLFGQTSAPTGWTKDTTNYNNSALRVVTGAAGTGGSVDFTTAFVSNRAVTISSLTGSAGATTLTTPQIPSHSHPMPVYSAGGGPGQATATPNNAGGVFSTGNAGGGGSHTHPLTVSSGSGEVNLAVKYVDVIRATKD
jgi:hypothetical protein